eukprot:CAMPEP_0184482192 /NCGR_PEP_ID=MMETSP0113_2-20130426/3769_1 /TAXON_ID=91329 /ORGANISM="Norrisiella sphaerica, Strain BC52" /LENGTH=495 /DNA_ID=CAMNT_0026861791 /DNA_START=339 /DNA_END=1826 /DNA_ORIENTATION=-
MDKTESRMLGDSSPVRDMDSVEDHNDIRNDSPHPRRWLVLTVFSLVAQGNGMIFLALSSISGKAQTFYGVSENRVNLTVILFYAVYVPFMPIATWMVNTTDGLRKVVLVAAFSMALGTGIRVFAFEGTKRSFDYLILGTSIAAINGPFLMACFTLVPANWFPDSERGLATSIGVLANQMGMVVGYLIPPLIVSETENNDRLKTQMTVCHITLFAISLFSAALAYALFKSKPGESQSEPVVSRALRSREEMPLEIAFKLCITNPDFWAYGVGFALVAPLYWDMGSLLYQNMSPSGYSDAQIQIPGVVLQAIAIPGMISAGKLIDLTHQFEGIIIFSLSLALLSMGVFTWALTLKDSAQNLFIITLAAASLGFAFSMVQPALLDVVAERTHPVPHGYTCSTLYLGTMIIGALYIVLGDALNPLKYNILLTALIAIVLASVVAVPCIFPRPHEKYNEDIISVSVDRDDEDDALRNTLDSDSKELGSTRERKTHGGYSN